MLIIIIPTHCLVFTVVTAGGGAYYFAKKQINADRAEKFEKEQRRRRYMEELEYNSKSSTSKATSHPPPPPPIHDPSGSPSSEKAEPAPTRHAPDSEEAKVLEKGKYEASQPFRSKKGDRFS